MNWMGVKRIKVNSNVLKSIYSLTKFNCFSYLRLHVSPMLKYVYGHKFLLCSIHFLETYVRSTLNYRHLAVYTVREERKKSVRLGSQNMVMALIRKGSSVRLKACIVCVYSVFMFDNSSQCSCQFLNNK